MSDPFDTGVVTIMFTDVEGSTDLTRRLGDEAARRTIDAHKSIIRAKLAEHDGREIDSIGDGFMITFLSTRRAITCAVDIQRALEAHGEDHPDEALRVRIGLNVGEVLERGGHPFGAAVNATQRVAGHARGGEILVSEPVRHLAGTLPDLRFRDRGRRSLKGFPERWRLFEVVWRLPKEKPPARPRPKVTPGRRRQVLLGAIPASIALLALAAFLVLRGDGSTLDRVAPNSVGIIDPGSGDIVGQVPVGRTPVDIAFGEGSLWVANQDGGTVSKIDPDSGREEDRFSPSGKPGGITVGAGKVWVANQFSNNLAVLRPDGTVDDTIELSGPKDVAAGTDAVWVVANTDREVVRIDADTYDLRKLSDGTAVAVGPNGVWVANGRALTRFDLGTSKPIGRSFELRFPATQVAVGDDGVAWVTHQSEDAVSRVDPDSSPTAFEDVANDPTGIAVGEGSVWVANSLGSSLVRLNAETGDVEREIPLGSAPHGVIVASGQVWVTTAAG
jgi:class 3 adenylate cyclase/streptogramin lyase